MKKHYLFLLSAVMGIAGSSYAQSVEPCANTEMYKKYKQQYPAIEAFEKIQEANIKAFVENHRVVMPGARTTADADTSWYDIPVVVHIQHNYGAEQIKDNDVYKLISDMNKFYSASNDTSSVIKPFKKWVGNAHMRFHLATKDPNGNPTSGITRRRTYLTYGGDDQSKLDQWPPTSYLNIYFENVIGRKPPSGTVLAYAMYPTGGAGAPFWDGIISGYSYILDGSTIQHEAGHYFNLAHPWETSGDGPGETCGDDGVDDTPPTKGHFSTCPLYDTACAQNYFKIYPSASGGDSLVNYPDTTNTQNTMDYSSCTNMFTKGQVVRMHAALNSDVAGRNNLPASSNLALTGALDTRADLKPIPEFSALPNGAAAPTKDNYMDRMGYFAFPNVNVKFVNETWRDTVSSLVWTFSNTASSPTVTQTNPTFNVTTFNNSFADPGWVTLSMTATGNNNTDTTVTWPRAIFVADAVATPAAGYIQEFTGADTAKWAMFNYYGNTQRWKYANVGYYDNTSVEYEGYDPRTFYINGSVLGDFDDLFSTPFDLSTFGSGPCTMSFKYSGASRSSMSLHINDQLEIAYSTNKSNTWTPLQTLKKGSLINKGALMVQYSPITMQDWADYSVNIPAAARTPYTVFRFRYKPSVYANAGGTLAVIDGTASSGNNWYMDRLSFTAWPVGIENVNMDNIDVAVVPNPTQGDAYVIIKDASYATANISVTDITGKVVYTTTAQLQGSQATVQIPQAVLSVKGMYLVQVVTGNQARTQKLVVQ